MRSMLDVLLACHPPDEVPESEGDTDTDADSDSDTDTAAPDFFPVTITALTGTITLRTALDGIPYCDLDVAVTFDPTGAHDPWRSWSAPAVSTVVRNDGKSECETAPLVPDELYLTVRTLDPKADMGLSYQPSDLVESEVQLYSYEVDPAGTDWVLLAHGKHPIHYEDENLLVVDQNWPPTKLSWNSDATIKMSGWVPYEIASFGEVEATWVAK